MREKTTIFFWAQLNTAIFIEINARFVSFTFSKMLIGVHVEIVINDFGCVVCVEKRLYSFCDVEA